MQSLESSGKTKNDKHFFPSGLENLDFSKCFVYIQSPAPSSPPVLVGWYL